ncbi:MAG: serine/threonine-protein kinase, partial [Deltaproteobacteria bacterium]|nr:serine/threonine-protein kinase [Deltaproteobacteria bacterium]
MVTSPLNTPTPPKPPEAPAAPAAPAIPGVMSAGTRLGRYEIVSDLGAGGMATVYLGRALSVAGFQRLVAIKLLHPHLLRDETFVQMFLDEGRLAARIHHPNVVGTLDLERSPEGLYIVSEYIEGDQLLGLYKAARATEQRIPRPIALRIALDVLAGLQAAHDLTDDLGTALRIVHRDVSPHNILVGSDGITRLTDFGIAKAEERIADTRDGIVKGKLSYMAPEQPNDSPIDRRADLFSLGTVLWECLTGRRLFPGKTDAEVLQALLNRPIARLRAVDPELPEALDGVLARALDRDPARRWQSAREFSDALEGAVGASEIASYRVVADHVKQVAAPKIIAEHERRRATTRDLPVYRPSVESLRAISAIPSPGRASSPPEPPTPLPSVASADEAPTQMQSAMMPPTMPTARGIVAPPPLPGPNAKLVTAGPEATTVRPPADHRASGARLLPPLPPLP